MFQFIGQRAARHVAHDEIGVALTAVTSGAGENPPCTILRVGQVDINRLVGLPAGYVVGDHIAGSRVLLGETVNANA